jgi:hypothetical protein
LIAFAIEFTAQPVIPTNGTFLFVLYDYRTIGVLLVIYYSRATSTTRTVFRLNTSQSHAYEDYHLQHLNIYV